MPRLKSFVVCILVVGVATAEGEKKPLDHSSYDLWSSIQGQAISSDGSWALYTLRPAEGDSILHIRHTTTSSEYAIPRGTSARFTRDGRFAVYQIAPDPEEVKKATAAKKPDSEIPKPVLEIRNLADGGMKRIKRASRFSLPEESGRWIAYLMEKPADEAKAEDEDAKEAAKAKKKFKKSGSTLVVCDLEKGCEYRINNVASFEFTRDGSRIAYVTSTVNPEDDGVTVLDLEDGRQTHLVTGRGNYRSLTWDHAGKRLAFLTDRDDYEAKDPAWVVWAWKPSRPAAEAVAAAATEGVPSDWEIAESRSPSFSRDGTRLFVGTRPKPPEPVKKPAEVKVDVWHWQDPLLQPMQLVQAPRLRNRTFEAVVHLDDGKFVQLADEDITSVTVGDRGNAPHALGSDSMPYRMLTSWDSPGYSDVYLIDVATGEREKILTQFQGRPSLSPTGRYVTWFDAGSNEWFAMDIGTRETVNLSGKIPHPLEDELHDRPEPPRPYGSAGWLKDDAAMLVYDKHDVWALDPTGQTQPECVTDGFGREHGLRFRVQRLDRDERGIDPAEPLLLSAFHLEEKTSGFFRDGFGPSETPEKLVLLPEDFGPPRKAEDADKFLLTRQTFQRYPDLWVAGPEFKQFNRLSEANPQQGDFSWGTAELMDWESLDGTRLQGIVYKPEGFDKSKKYPMLVYFYERYSDTIHRYHTPAPSRASINISFYVSRGYVVFVPDIPYRTGYPGQSCLNAVLPGVTKLIEAGYIDRARIGMQGHSWGGYQVAYLVTRTKLFAAAEAGAPVSNMTSAYGGIRWSSGMSRMFQYEKTQSRIGGTLWDSQQKYIENSPVFWADRVETPLLMLHNDKDGAVPWYQSIEMFVALRRLGKPAWMINYNDADHGLSKDADKRDWSVRMQQFFDHYLKGEPPPVWLAEGVPAKDKGRTLGLDLVK